jgi:hypothetical protein
MSDLRGGRNRWHFFVFPVLTRGYAQERKELNDLICLQIKNSDKAVQAKEAVGHMTRWLTDTNTKVAIKAKGAFEKSYAAIMKPESITQTESVLQPISKATQEGVQSISPVESLEIVDVKSSMPMLPQGPQLEPEEGTFNIEVRHLDIYQSSERRSQAAIGSSKIFSVAS